jgi:hypothetical protein
MPSHAKKPTEHQPELEPESEPNRPRTRPKNATHRPGADAMLALRVQRDRALVAEEKEARLARKEGKERERQEEEANKKEAESFIKEHHTRQKAAMAEQEASIPRRTSQGTGYFHIFSA